MESIYKFTDYLEYLREFYRYHKVRNTNYSYQLFADEAGLPSRGFAKILFDGTRKPTLKTMPKLIKGLKLKAKEGQYFETMVYYNITTDPEKKRELYLKMISFPGRMSFFPLEVSQYIIFSSPIHLVVHSMFWLKGFPVDVNAAYEWIKTRLDEECTIEEIKKIIKDLMQVGVINIQDGKFYCEKFNLAVSNRSNNLAISEYVRGMIKVGINRLHSGKKVDHLSVVTLPIDTRKIHEIREHILEFRDKMMSKYHCLGQSDFNCVTQLNIQFFPRTKDIS